MNANAKILKRHAAFSPLSSAVLRKLTAHASVEHFTKGQEIYNEGQPCSAMFLLLSGRCQSRVRFQEGSEREINVYLPGDTFGEGAVISRDHYWTTIRVLTDSFVLRISAADIHSVLQKDSRLQEHFYGRLQRHRSDFRNRPELSSLGRVVTVLRLSPLLDLHGLSEHLAKNLRSDLKRAVLVLNFFSSGHHPEPVLLSDWAADSTAVSGIQRRKMKFDRLDLPGIRSLTVTGDLEEPGPAVSHLISFMSALFRYVLVSIPSGANEALAQACVTQSDHSLAFLLLDEENEAKLHAWQGRLEPGWVTPVLCHEQGLPKQEGRSELRQHRTLILNRSDPRHKMALTGMTRFITRGRIGLALSSGGAKGLAHIGVLQVMEEQGIAADCVAGSSMGACIAALWASGMSGSDIEGLALKLERRFSMLRLVDPVFPPRRGFMKGRAIYRWLKEYLGDLYFEDLPRKLYIVITDMETLEEVVVDSGPILPAVHASMAMPGVIVPPRFQGRHCFDGSVANPLPVSVLQDEGVEHVIAVNTIPNPEDLKQCAYNPDAEEESRQSSGGRLRRHIDYFAEGNLLDTFMRSMHGAQTRVAEAACARADVTLRPVSCDGAWHDFSNPRKYLALGRQAALDQLTALQMLEDDR
jgi:NTE family protein